MGNVKRNDTVLLIPDVHGREFWKDGLKERHPDELMIFLGDYTDPYPAEGITHEVIPDMLEEILKIPNTILLLGNHDLSYIYPSQSPSVRKDPNFERNKWLGKFFEDNHSRFCLTYTLKRDDKFSIIFSHAGLLKDLYHHWDHTRKKYSPIEVAKKFNEMWKNHDSELPSELFKISWIRGGWNENGSLVWADIREHIARRNDFWSHDFQVFGHTMLVTGKTVRLPQFACVDCQRPVRMRWNMKKPEFEVL